MEKVKATVVILCYNEINYIERCLASVFNFHPIDGGFEVVVVDGMSVDGTRDILKTWVEKKPKLIIIDNPGRVTPIAMNLGIKAASGEYITFLSAHVEYEPDLLASCMNTFEKVDADNVGGILITLPGSNSYQARIVQALTTHRFGVGNSEFRIGSKEGYSDTVVYGCYRRDVFTRIGLHDERLVRNQDYEINQRLLKAGGKIWQNPNIKSYYFNQGTIFGLLRQGWSNGKWNPWMWYVAPYSLAPRHTIPGLFLIALLFSLIITGLFSWGWLLALAILFPYFSLAIISSYQQSSKYSWKMFAILPFLFFTYHLSYGAGILWGSLILLTNTSPVQGIREPWPGAGRYRAWPPQNSKTVEVM